MFGGVGGDAVQGESLARQARASLLQAYPAGGTKLGEIDVYLADILDTRNSRDEARAMRNEALKIFRAIYGDAIRSRAP